MTSGVLGGSSLATAPEEVKEAVLFIQQARLDVHALPAATRADADSAPAVANGHEARRWIGARDSLNNPYKLVEACVNVSHQFLLSVILDSVYRADTTISSFADPGHLVVKDNYIVQGGKCGQAWVCDTNQGRYLKVDIRQQQSNGNTACT